MYTINVVLLLISWTTNCAWQPVRAGKRNVNALFEQGTSNSGNLIQFKQTTTGSVARTAYIGHGGDNTGLLMLQNSAGIYSNSAQHYLKMIAHS